MPAFGRDGMMKRADIETVADYVRSIAGLPVEPKADLAAGKKIFAEPAPRVMARPARASATWAHPT